MEIAGGTLHAANTIVAVDDKENLIRVWSRAVVVFVPENHDGVASFAPYRRTVNGVDEPLNRDITSKNERGIQAGLRAVADRVEIAKGSCVPSTVLIVALVGCNEGERGDTSGSKIRK